MSELRENEENVVFIDELHTLVGAGSAEGTLDAANILKPALSRGEIQCIGATTPGEFRKTIEKDRALERRFQAVKIVPPSEAEPCRSCAASSTVRGVPPDKVYKEALEASVSNRTAISRRFLPDKAIDVLDEAAPAPSCAIGRKPRPNCRGKRRSATGNGPRPARTRSFPTSWNRWKIRFTRSR